MTYQCPGIKALLQNNRQVSDRNDHGFKKMQEIEQTFEENKNRKKKQNMTQTFLVYSRFRDSFYH